MAVSDVRPVDSALRTSAWLAIASGLAGLLSFACLMSYLFHPALHIPVSGATPLMGRVLLNSDFLAAMLQAVLLLPMAYRFPGSGVRSLQAVRVARIVGVTGFLLVAVLRLLPVFSSSVSDILFMAPTGLVGAWLVMANWPRGSSAPNAMPSRGVAILGVIAGALLVGVGLNFVFNGGMAVFTQGPLAYSNNVPFHIGLALTGGPGFNLFSLWSILLGVKMLRVVRKPV